MNSARRMGLGRKIGLAAVSGLLVALSSLLPFFQGFIFPSLYWIGLAGVLFVVGVFFPYVRRDRLLMYRCLGLVVVGAIGYWCAFWAGIIVVAELGLDERFGYSAGCLVAAAILLAGARVIVPLTHSITLVIAGLAAAIVGGFAFWLPPSLWQGSSFAWVAWHGVMALAVHVAEDLPLLSGTGER